MRRWRIEQLLEELPPDSPYNRFLPATENYYQTKKRQKNKDSIILDYAFFDLKFAWRFAQSFVEMDRGLPLSAQEEHYINRAWDYGMDKEWDPIIGHAFALENPHHKRKRDMVKSMLLIPDKSLAEIADTVDLEEEDIEAYEFLFFDIRDRMREKDFIAKLVFPDGIQSEFRENFIIQEDLGQLMMRAAHSHGQPLLDAVGGFKSAGNGGECNSAEASQRMESSMMSNGLLLSQLGLYNQHNVPGINHAKSIMLASKQAGAPQKVDDDIVGLGGMGIAFSIANDVMKLQEKDVEYRNFVRSKIAERDAKARGKIIPMEGQIEWVDRRLQTRSIHYRECQLSSLDGKTG